MNILFTNAGRRTYLIEDALALSQSTSFKVQVFVCDTTFLTASMLVSPEVVAFLTPHVSDSPERYADILIEECVKRKIDLIIPLMDYELPILAKRRSDFKARGIDVVVSPADVIDTMLDKQQTWYFCAKHGLNMPRTWFSGQAPERNKVPLILKRTLGSGSVDQVTLGKPEQVPEFVPTGFLIQEMIAGVEYGMDILNDFNGNYLHCCARRKIAMRAGETDKAETVYEERFENLGKNISAALRHIGVLDIDIIIDSSGNVIFLDFNPRFGGGYPFTRAAGFDYLNALIDLARGGCPQLSFHGRNIMGSKGVKLYTTEINSECFYNC